MSASDFRLVQLRAANGARAALYPHGAHLVSWIGTDGVERLFTSRSTELRSGAAIRGGVPVIFPQFAGLGPLPKHGFARSLPWQRAALADAPADRAAFTLAANDITQALWPHEFLARLDVQLEAEALRITLAVTNTGPTPFAFTAALHTYLRVSDIGAASITGLAGVTYRDSTAGNREVVQDTAPLAIAGEVDRIYLGTRAPVRIHESGRRALVSELAGFTDSVVWNPGAQKGAALADLEPEGYRRFLCVEAAVIGTAVSLAPGAGWSGTQRLTMD